MIMNVFSFLTTSLFMALIILVILTLTALFPKAFSPKLRYTAWVVVLIGLVIPFRPMFGNGLIIFQVPYTATVESQRQPSEVGVSLTEPPTVGDIEQNATVHEPASQNTLPIGQTISIMHLLIMVWVAVAVTILAYHVWRYVGFKKLIKRWSVVVNDGHILSVLQTVQTKKGIANKKIVLRKCDFVSTSMIIGFLRPVILLPDKDFDSDELELIFRHELIHYKRGDLFIKLLSVIAISLNWFNPAVYLMSAAMQADCEASCDEAVIADVGRENRQFYAEIIMDMIGSKKSNGTILSTSFYGSKSYIKKRMEAIMNTSSDVKKIAFSTLTALVMLIVFSGSIFAFSGQESSEQPQQEPLYLQHLASYTDDYVTAQTPSGTDVAGTVSEPTQQYTPEPAPESTPRQHYNRYRNQQSTQQPQTGGQGLGNRPSNPAISLERAIEIGYAEIARRGYTGTFRSDSGMDWEPRYGGWVWEVLFRVQGGRLPLVEMYICVHTGNVAKFEWDD